MMPLSSPLYCRHCGAANPVGSRACFACQYALDTLEEHEQDILLMERYRVLSQVGTGGFGAVYKAVDTSLADKIVAIKQINLQGLSVQEVIEATDGFHREVRYSPAWSHRILRNTFASFRAREHGTSL